MQEDFLHYIWKHKKFQFQNLKTTTGEDVIITTGGQHNFNAGPDFFNAQLKIGEQLWAGNVEIHVKSSDWYLHNHEQDVAYDNVILHVVWEHDTEIFRKDNSAIPTLQLSTFTDATLLYNYKKLFIKQNKWINCEKGIASIDGFSLNNWLERLYFERLERKSKIIESLLEQTKNDWEAVFFIMLAKNFGLKVNGESFFSLAQSIDFSIVRKTQPNQLTVEGLLFGQAGLLSTDLEDPYFLSLKKEYQFLKQKFKLENQQVLPLHFFRLRPPNFPTIRLSQLANLYHQHQNVFSKVIHSNRIEDFYDLLKIETSSYWKTHYTFQKESKPVTKTLSKPFIDLLLINTILPIKLCYAKHKGEEGSAAIIKIASKILSENNNIIDGYKNLGIDSKSSLESQALIQLKTEYCDKNQCLKCAVGNQLLAK